MNLAQAKAFLSQKDAAQFERLVDSLCSSILQRITDAEFDELDGVSLDLGIVGPRTPFMNLKIAI